MRVFVNAVAARIGGGRKHIVPFVEGLAALPDLELVVAAPQDVVDALAAVPRCTTMSVDLPGGVSPARLRWELSSVRGRLRGWDAVVSPLNFGPLRPGVPHVLFQRNATYFDPVFREAVTARRRGRMAAHRWWASACMRDSDVVVVPSNAMGQLVAPYAGSTPIRVVHHGFDAAEWRRWSLGDPPAGIERWEGADVRLLFVSQPYRQKDVPLLADTLLALRRRGVDAHLAVTFDADDPSPGAREFDRRCSVHGVSDAVTHLGAVSQQHAAALMCRASVLLYPSISESFGFPLLEAQAVDLPVVATDIPSTLEIGGPCVLTHPPRDAAAAADEVQRAITRDERGAAEARSWVERFSWDAHCRQVYEIIREVGN